MVSGKIDDEAMPKPMLLADQLKEGLLLSASPGF